MRNTRRSFIVGSIATALSASIPLHAAKVLPRAIDSNDLLIERLKRNEHLDREVFQLDRPLVIDFPTTSLITTCDIVCSATYTGNARDAFITLDNPKCQLAVIGCRIKGRGGSLLRVTKNTQPGCLFDSCYFENTELSRMSNRGILIST